MNKKSPVFVFEKTKTAVLGAILGFVLSFYPVTSVFAASQNETPPFSEQLKGPPTFVPEFMAEKENAAALYSDEIYAIYATDKANQKNHKTTTVTASQITEKNWSFGIEAKNSPIQEEHGNAERLESKGGMLKGTLHF